MQAPNTHKNAHRQSAGQILKPLKDASKIHSEQQATRFNLNPYSDNVNNEIEPNENPGSDETSKTPSGATRLDNPIPEMSNKRNRSYTRGRKSGVRNQQGISQTLQNNQIQGAQIMDD